MNLRNGEIRDRSSCRRSAIVLTGTGITESSLLNTRCDALSVPATIWPRVCLSELMRSAHCRSMRRWMLNGYMALIRSTSLTRSYVRISLRGIRSLGERSRGDLEGSKRSRQMAAQTPQTHMTLTRVEFRAHDFLIEYQSKRPGSDAGPFLIERALTAGFRNPCRPCRRPEAYRHRRRRSSSAVRPPWLQW